MELISLSSELEERKKRWVLKGEAEEERNTDCWGEGKPAFFRGVAPEKFTIIRLQWSPPQYILVALIRLSVL